MNADQIRKELGKAAADRAAADRQKERATAKAVALLRQVGETDGITMSEAAELLGVSRVGAYKMLDG